MVENAAETPGEGGSGRTLGPVVMVVAVAGRADRPGRDEVRGHDLFDPDDVLRDHRDTGLVFVKEQVLKAIFANLPDAGRRSALEVGVLVKQFLLSAAQHVDVGRGSVTL